MEFTSQSRKSHQFSKDLTINCSVFHFASCLRFFFCAPFWEMRLSEQKNVTSSRSFGNLCKKGQEFKFRYFWNNVIRINSQAFFCLSPLKILSSNSVLTRGPSEKEGHFGRHRMFRDYVFLSLGCVESFGQEDFKFFFLLKFV